MSVNDLHWHNTADGRSVCYEDHRQKPPVLTLDEAGVERLAKALREAGRGNHKGRVYPGPKLARAIIAVLKEEA